MSEELAVMAKTETLPVTSDGGSIQIAGGIQLPAIQEMNKAWQEFTERQDHFKELIMSRMQEGVDYGVAPGCEQKLDENGNILQWSKRKNAYATVPKTQWRSTPMLYQKGALKLKDLFKSLGYPLRPEFNCEVKGNAYFSTCRLIHEDTGQIMGEGRGLFRDGEKGMKDNTALQMADKRSFVSAIRRTLPCVGELFTEEYTDKEKAPANTATITPQKDTSEFTVAATDWIEECIEPDYDITERDIKTLRSHLATWPEDDKRTDVATAIKWCKMNVKVAEENKRLKFSLKDGGELPLS